VVEQVTFSGDYAAKCRQPVLFITERAVFSLEDGHLALIEVAPGIDVEKDIIAHMGFRPRASPAPKSMPAEIFRSTWGGLRAILETKGSSAPAS
jgi:propionate CoA-transferase